MIHPLTVKTSNSLSISSSSYTLSMLAVPVTRYSFSETFWISCTTASCSSQWEIGIRIEDDILITEDGCEVLSENLMRDPDQIEAFMQEKEA